MRRALALALFLLLALASSAAARTVQADLDTAHEYWNTTVCAGQWQVIPDWTLPERNAQGEATGIGFTHNPTSGTFESGGTRWDWFIRACEFTVYPKLQGVDRCYTVGHEVGHFVEGPDHDGAMAAAALESLARLCAQKVNPVRAAVRRTRKVTSRVLRYRAAQRRIALRRAARIYKRLHSSTPHQHFNSAR